MDIIKKSEKQCSKKVYKRGYIGRPSNRRDGYYSERFNTSGYGRNRHYQHLPERFSNYPRGQRPRFKHNNKKYQISPLMGKNYQTHKINQLKIQKKDSSDIESERTTGVIKITEKNRKNFIKNVTKILSNLSKDELIQKCITLITNNSTYIPSALVLPEGFDEQIDLEQNFSFLEYLENQTPTRSPSISDSEYVPAMEYGIATPSYTGQD
ncbi:hypothetical protein A3Q56_02194 [Intoshia linei]|uniref:Uncharacterized protein n=1 Tax=Intoshia linei TaxID=1819745 RepID=A0A177B6Y4_9BILA|nr:hypothetical protein A3Q56_02194 [Intoshia linei]